MARQAGLIKICGTIQGISFYTMEGEHYARTKSSLDKKRFMKDPAFEGSRRSAGLLATASVLASQLYRQLPAEVKSRRAYQLLTGRVKLMLQGGNDEKAVADWFKKTYKRDGHIAGDEI
jgi:hypothetical protein